MTDISLGVADVETAVSAISPEEVAAEQVKVQEQQRVFGIVPNFYVTYEHDAAPLTPKLKFQLAIKALTDPVTIAGFGMNAAIYQAAGYPSYAQGAAGYGKRLGATFAGGYSKILLGDAVFPSLLHQDPRYFYQGTGTTKSRLLHALATPLFTRGDDGRREINYSNILGDLASGALANAYYPSQERGAGLVLRNAAIGVGGRMVLASFRSSYCTSGQGNTAISHAPRKSGARLRTFPRAKDRPRVLQWPSESKLLASLLGRHLWRD